MDLLNKGICPPTGQIDAAGGDSDAEEEAGSKVAVQHKSFDDADMHERASSKRKGPDSLTRHHDDASLRERGAESIVGTALRSSLKSIETATQI